MKCCICGKDKAHKYTVVSLKRDFGPSESLTKEVGRQDVYLCKSPCKAIHQKRGIWKEFLFIGHVLAILSLGIGFMIFIDDPATGAKDVPWYAYFIVTPGIIVFSYAMVALQAFLNCLGIKK